MPFIELKNVNKIFHAGDEEYAALKGISLGINSGEFVAVMGPSGSGKSTLLSLIGGLSRASSGVVSIDDIDLGSLGPNKLSDFRREYLGFVFQSFYLVPYLTAIENVMLPLTIQPGLNGAARDMALGALARSGPEPSGLSANFASASALQLSRMIFASRCPRLSTDAPIACPAFGPYARIACCLASTRRSITYCSPSDAKAARNLLSLP